MRDAFAAALLLLCSLGLAAQDSQKTEQTLFEAYGNILHQVSLPPDVLDVVRGNVPKHACREALRTAPPGTGFSAAAIRLHRKNSTALLVRFRHDCLGDTRTARFWIVSADNPRPEFYTSGSSLQLLDSYTNDYRDLRSVRPEGDIATITVDEKFELASQFGSAGYKVTNRKRELISASCFADQAVTLTIASEKAQFHIGEPIHMSVTMKNATSKDLDWNECFVGTCERSGTGQTCMVHTGDRFRFVARDERGNSVDSSDDYRHDLVGWHFCEGTFEACRTREYRVDLNHMFKFTHAGRYRVEVQRRKLDDPANELLKSNAVIIDVSE